QNAGRFHPSAGGTGADRLRAAVMTRIPTTGAPAEVTAETCGDRDCALLAALRRGAPDAAEQLIAAYGDRGFRLAVSITGSAPDAAQVVQAALRSGRRLVTT